MCSRYVCVISHSPLQALNTYELSWWQKLYRDKELCLKCLHGNNMLLCGAMSMKNVAHRCDFEHTKDTPYLTIMDNFYGISVATILEDTNHVIIGLECTVVNVIFFVQSAYGRNDISHIQTASLCFFSLWLFHHTWVDSWDPLTHILQGYFTGTGAVIWLPQCQWHNPEEYR